MFGVRCSVFGVQSTIRGTEPHLGINVVRFTTWPPVYPDVWEECCTKYKNYPAKPSGGEEMLYFIQQSWIRANILRKMLYFVQDLA